MDGPHRNAPPFPGVSYSSIPFSYSMYVHLTQDYLLFFFGFLKLECDAVMMGAIYAHTLDVMMVVVGSCWLYTILH